MQSGDIFCRDSIQYRSFEDDLIDEDTWEQKESIIQNLNLTTLQQPIEQHLKELENKLEARLISINKKITSEKQTCASKNTKNIIRGHFHIRERQLLSIIHFSIYFYKLI